MTNPLASLVILVVTLAGAWILGSSVGAFMAMILIPVIVVGATLILLTLLASASLIQRKTT
jgi:hypothetical protein